MWNLEIFKDKQITTEEVVNYLKKLTTTLNKQDFEKFLFEVKQFRDSIIEPLTEKKQELYEPYIKANNEEKSAIERFDFIFDSIKNTLNEQLKIQKQNTDFSNMPSINLIGEDKIKGLKRVKKISIKTLDINSIPEKYLIIEKKINKKLIEEDFKKDNSVIIEGLEIVEEEIFQLGGN